MRPPLGQLMRRLVAEDLAAPGFAHQPGAQVDGVAKDRVLRPLWAADAGAEELASGDAQAAHLMEGRQTKSIHVWPVVAPRRPT